MQFNLLPSLPGSVADLKALKTLDLSHNQLTSLPPALYSLPHLDYLNLNHNRLQALPEQGLSHLTALELNLSTNSLSRLPAELGMCKRLKVLRVEENCLELAGLPQQLLEESKVSLLCLDGNLFQQKELQELPGYQQVHLAVQSYCLLIVHLYLVLGEIHCHSKKSGLTLLVCGVTTTQDVNVRAHNNLSSHVMALMTR